MKKKNIIEGVITYPSKKELTGRKGGAWDEETHLNLYPDNFNLGLANYITQIIKPKNFLEFGSGLGFLAKYLVEHLSIDDAFCIEPNKIKSNYNNSAPKLLTLNIFEDPLPQLIHRQFDLILSIEVAEHIERNLHNTLFDFLVDHSSNWIVFSGARIGQGGHGHIAEREENDWKSEFTKRGMVFQQDLTLEIREACDIKNINHRKNLMIFKKYK